MKLLPGYFIKGMVFFSLFFEPIMAACASEIPEVPQAAWKEDFTDICTPGKACLPKGWAVRKKPGTKPAVFGVIKDGKANRSYLHMEADKASATIITKADGVDLTDTPILRWRWRVTRLPEGADGRNKNTDDQAIGIYVGSGNNPAFVKSISYRWDTLTPKGASGVVSYGGGAVKVKWFTLRNQSDDGKAGWVTEERNIAEDFREAWGFYPKKLYISVSCNSQYTGTKAAADLDWVELVSSKDYKAVEQPRKGFKRYLIDLFHEIYGKSREKAVELFNRHKKGAPENDIR